MSSEDESDNGEKDTKDPESDYDEDYAEEKKLTEVLQCLFKPQLACQTRKPGPGDGEGQVEYYHIDLLRGLLTI